MNPLTPLPMSTPAPTHTLDHQLGCRKRNSSNHSNSFTSSFAMTMPIKTIGTISIKEQLAEMTHVITKLTKTIEEERSTNSIPHEQALF